ncbi:hypothetical protein JCM1841_003507 [Sporobolomyces salmonicolor]
MSDSALRGRGRGRGRRIVGATLSGATVESGAATASPSPAPEARSRTTTSGSATPAPADAVDDAPSGSERATPAPGAGKPAVKRVASVALARVPSIGVGSSRGPVGGLLAGSSQYKNNAAGAAGASKPKFKPNVAAARRKQTVIESDDDRDVKMEEVDGWKKRGPRPPRQRQELEMTASGPMAQGPGGAPRAWGARPAMASGAAVMAASRDGTLNAALADDEDASDLDAEADPGDTGDDGSGTRRHRIRATDLNDIGLGEGEGSEGEGLAPLVLPRDPKVLRTKVRRLKERKVERLKKEALKAKSEQPLVKPEPGDDAMSLDTTPSTTPGPSEAKSGTLDSKEGSLALLDVDLEAKEAKDLKDLEEEEKKEINLSQAFSLEDRDQVELYMFQFPRKFPLFAPKPSSSSSKPAPADDPTLDNLSLADSKIKADPDAPAASLTSSAGVRKPNPPPWGRAGTRREKAARWSEEMGKIGKLRVHRSGKVTLKLFGDLRYEVLPAAQPSFLQEIAILDHRAAPKPASSPKPKKPRKGKKKRSSSSSESSSESASSDSGSEREPDVSPETLTLVGQTSKKFIVVPEVGDLLKRIAEQEKMEKDEERRQKLRVKKEGGAARAK